jgi:enoyl-CoA hydratase
MRFPEFECFAISVPEPHVAQVLMSSTRRGNPVGDRFLAEIGPAFEAISQDTDIRAVVLCTLDKDFSFGLDLMGVAPMLAPWLQGGEAGRAEILRKGGEWQQALSAVAACSKPVVAAINGWCIGAGLELIAACDVRLCSDDAKFSLREVKVGIVADLGGLQRLPQLISAGHLRQMAFTGDDFTAAQALQMGLVNASYASAELCRSEALALAKRMAQNPPRVLAGIKAVLNAQSEATVPSSLQHALSLNAKLFQTQDFLEAVSSAMQKRPGVFTGQ